MAYQNYYSSTTLFPGYLRMKVYCTPEDLNIYPIDLPQDDKLHYLFVFSMKQLNIIYGVWSEVSI